MKRRHAQSLVAEWERYGCTEDECREWAPWAFPEPPAVKTPAGCATLPEDQRRTYNVLSAPGSIDRKPRRHSPARMAQVERMRALMALADYGTLPD